MNNLDMRLSRLNSSQERDEEGMQILERFRFMCKFFHIEKGIINELDALQEDFNRTGFFSDASWLKFLSIFQSVIETRANSNITFLRRDWGNLESTKIINASLYKFGINIIQGYVGYLRSEIIILQSRPMSLDTAELVTDMEDEIAVLMEILSESNVKTDWRGFRNYLDDIQARIIKTKRLLEKSESRKSAIEKFAHIPVLNNVVKASVQKKIETPVVQALARDSMAQKIKPVSRVRAPEIVQQEPKPTIEETIESTREEAWGALLESTVNGKHITKHKLEDIQTKLHKAGIPYDATTNTIINSIQKDEPEIQGTDILDMNNPKTEEAFVETIPKLIEGEGDRVTKAGYVGGHDYHKIYGTRAANGELMYNNLAETFSGKGELNPVKVSFIKSPELDFTSFEILTNKRKAPGSRVYEMRVCIKRPSSNVVDLVTIECIPEEVRAGAPARIKILQKGGQYKNIELTFVNIADKRKPQSETIWDKTKSSVKSTWNNWFSKKAA